MLYIEDVSYPISHACEKGTVVGFLN